MGLFHWFGKKPGKLGRAAKGSLKAPYLHDRVVGSLPTPPPRVISPHPGNWYMMGNDWLGDCVVAGIVHVIRAVYKFLGVTFTITAQQAEAWYYKLGIEQGGTPPKPDNGLVIDSTLVSWLKDNTIFDGKPIAFAKLDQTNETEIQQGISLFGAVILGINLPQSAYNSFPKKWVVVPGSKIIGGHCVIITGYDTATGLYDLITWGARIKATFEFVATYCDEAYVVLIKEIAAAGGYKGVGVAALQADCATL